MNTDTLATPAVAASPDGYFVQVLQEGFFTDKWGDIKGFDNPEDAEKLLKSLE